MKPGGHPYARRFQDLIVYQKARQLQSRVFQLTKRFPRDEMYSLTDQFRRAARSIGGQIAEAWARRDYERHFISKLTDADGEQLETQHWIITAADCGYLDQSAVLDLEGLCLEIGRILGTMKARAAEFCPKDDTLQEVSEEFFLPPELNTHSLESSPLTTDNCPLSTEH
ncbi:MAG TPA: four helix bundle protein [Verrucomicrobiae bacterium]|nr:four helix bundle protein [Verrucomicrobiae bacterium]